MAYFGKISHYNKWQLLDLLRRESIIGECYAIAVGCNHKGDIGIKFTSDRAEQDGSLPWWEGGCDDFSATTIYSRQELLDSTQ